MNTPMTNLRSNNKRQRGQAEGAAGKQATSRRKRDRVREAARKVIERRREVLEELAKR